MLNKPHELLFGLWVPLWTPSMEGKHKVVTLPRAAHCCTELHRAAVLRRHMPRQVKPVTCVFELGPHWWRVCSCISMCLNPMGSLYFCFLSLAWAHTQTDTHSHVSNLERCCCQRNDSSLDSIPCADKHTQTNTMLIKILCLVNQQCGVRAV